MVFKALFQPIKIGPVEIPNRIAMAPMATAYAQGLGYVSEQSCAYFGARAKGGTGLIITGAVTTNKLAFDTAMGAGLETLYDNRYIGGMSQLVERVHAFGAKIFVQLSPGFGRQGGSEHTGVQVVSFSTVPFFCPIEYLPEGFKQAMPEGYRGEVPRELIIPEIITVEDQFATAAMRAKMAGFDGIEIHSPHGYLIAQSLSPRANKRTDEYGGSLENRMRFLLNIIRKTRAVIGTDMALGARLSGDEHIEGGLNHEDLKAIAKKIEEVGVDYIHLSDGTYERMDRFFPATDGTMLDEAKGFKEVLTIPVITPAIHNPSMAEQAIKDHKTDMVALGRQLIADPEWANKVKKGRIGEIRKCDRDNHCAIVVGIGLPMRCLVNPDVGRERYIPEYWQPPYPVKE